MTKIVEDNTLIHEFLSSADRFLNQYPQLNCRKGKGSDENCLIFPPADENGFEVSAHVNGRGIVIYAGHIAHYHIHLANDIADTVSQAYGVIYDLLSPYTRIEESYVGDKPFSGEIQIKRDGQWTRSHYTRLMRWTLFKTKTKVIKQNHQLPNRIEK